jgi:hypothetical protein
MSCHRKLFTVPNIIGIILVIIGIILLIYGILRNYIISNVAKWPKTNAVVVSAYAVPVGTNEHVNPQNININNNNILYVPKITYEYSVNGKKYMSSNVVFSEDNAYNAIDTKALFSNISPNSVISVYYDPMDPSISYIYNGKYKYTTIVLGVVVILIAIIVFWYYNKKSGECMSPSLSDMDKKNIYKMFRGGLY